MPKTPLRKIYRYGPSGRFTRRQIREAIDQVKRQREQDAVDAQTAAASHSGAKRDPRVARA